MTTVAITTTATASERAASRARRDNVIRLVSLIVVLAVWEVYGRSVNPILFTYPTAVAQAAVTIIGSGELWTYLSASLLIFVQGLLLSIIVGIPLGVLMARFHLVDTVLEMYINALYSMPTVAIVPLLVLWFGFDAPAKTVIVFLFTVFPLLLNTYQGVKNVEANLLEVARSFCSSERRLWSDVIVPSALPYILVGLRLAIGRGLVGIVIADFYTAISGIGYLIVQYANSFQTAKLFVPIVTLMLLGIVLTELLKALERRITPWLDQNQAA
ncbi:MAG: ABC transporter permease [Chloroflexota bacterium]|nr:ABC transporter permease [Chloroflexota bacterium]